MSSPYANTVDHEDIDEQVNKRMERYKDEAEQALEQALIFAGLFAAVVTSSLIRRSEWSSPDSGDETVKLLTQTFKQLVPNSNEMPLETTESSQQLKRTTTVLMVNTLWFDCFVLSLTCSIFATLIHQVRRYKALTQEFDLVQPKGKPKNSRERASIPLRKALFESLKKIAGGSYPPVTSDGLTLIWGHHPLLGGYRLYFPRRHNNGIYFPWPSHYILSHIRHFNAFTALFLRLPIWHILLSTHVVLPPCLLIGNFLDHSRGREAI
ncbi:hypothetical protein V8E53_004728 [Lactarius tabidus]